VTDAKQKSAASDRPSGRGAGLLMIALLATIAIALSFVDATSARPGASLAAQPGFYAAAGLAASVALTMLARLLGIILGRTIAPAGADKPNAADRA
jgi:hypothetical protein